MAVRPAHHAVRLIHWCLGTVLALAVVTGLVALVTWTRLQQGPVRIPIVAEMVAERINAGNDRISVAIDGLELTLGDATRPTRLEFTGLAVRDQAGRPVLAVPRIGARFAMADLIAGRVQPTEIVIDGAATRVVRTAEGRIRVALSDAPGGQPQRAPDAAGRNMDTVGAIVDGFVGDGPEAPALAKLERVTIENADLTYLNAASGRTWRSEQARLSLNRTPEGATLAIEVKVAGERSATVALDAERRRGTGATRIVAAFDQVAPGDLAAEVPELGWLATLDAPLGGRLEATLGRDGSVGDLSGSLVAAGGTVLAAGREGVPFDRFAVAFSYEPGLSRMRIDQLEVAAKAADLSMSGFADLVRDTNGGDGRVTGLAAQLDIASLDLDLPALFADPQSFDGGRIVARLDLDGPVIEVAEARLRQGALGVSVSGRARPGENGWVSDLRIAGETIAVERLVALWPLRAASGARDWLSRNLEGGTVDEVLAHLRIGRGTPDLDLAFRFSDLSTRYLQNMTPITGASGRGHLSWERLDLFVDEGTIEPLPGKPIDLAGSTVEIDTIMQHIPPGRIEIHARGPTGSVLALLDEEPLGFIAKLDIAPGTVRGTTDLTTVLTLPLAADVRLADVKVDARARLSKVAMPFALALTGPLAVASERLDLVADTKRMRLEGRVSADGIPLDLAWEERYGGSLTGRDIRIKGTATPAILESINLALPGFEAGEAPLDVTIGQAKDRPSTFAVEADLGPATVSVAPVFWQKPAGRPGTVTARGTFGKTPTVIDELHLTGPGLEARAELTLYPNGGGVERARIFSLDMGTLANLTVDARARGPNGAGYDLDIGGRLFDLAFLERAGPPSEPPLIPLGARYAVERVRLSKGIELEGVEGDFSRAATGALEAELFGRIAGTAPVAITYAKTPDGPGRARLTAADAGRVLAAAKLFSGAEGGSLRVDAVIGPDPRTSIAGTALIKDVVVRQEARTFRRVLEEGALPEAAEEARGRGLAFDRVEVPFAVRGSRIAIETALATSPALAVKVAGTVNEVTRDLRLRGVISPAYALTGILNDLPLIGTLLGGEGEGILAMTFAVDGTAENPAVSVNPISLLAPGFLRNVFETDAFAAAPRPKTAAERISDAAAETDRPPPRTTAQQQAADAEQAERLKSLLESDF